MVTDELSYDFLTLFLYLATTPRNRDGRGGLESLPLPHHVVEYPESRQGAG